MVRAKDGFGNIPLIPTDREGRVLDQDGEGWEGK